MELKFRYKIRIKFVKIIFIFLGILIDCGYLGSCMFRIYIGFLGVFNISIFFIILLEVLLVFGRKLI